MDKVKSRTYRKVARKEFLKAVKSKRLSNAKHRTALRAQLQYIRRNLKTIRTKMTYVTYQYNDSQLRALETCQTVYNKQKKMYDEKSKSPPDRIVNLHQPHIPCIVRRNVGTPYEFGPMLSVSKVNGYINLDPISFDNFNERGTIPTLVEKYKKLYGVYPEMMSPTRSFRPVTTRNTVGIWASVSAASRSQTSEERLGRERAKQIMEDDFKKLFDIDGVFGVAKERVWSFEVDD